MSQSWYQNDAEFRYYFDKASELCDFESGLDLRTLCFEGPEEALKETCHCQVALYVQGYATYAALQKRGLLHGLRALVGLSVGEITALAVAQCMGFEEGLRIVLCRSRAMHRICAETRGAMAAVIGAKLEDIEPLCQTHEVDIANLNCPGQIVVSGDRFCIEEFAKAAKGVAKRIVYLDVAGAYHSRMMLPAGLELEEFLFPIKFKDPRIITYHNKTGKRVGKKEDIRYNLAQQVYSTVHFEDNVREAQAIGVNTWYECGPGGVLCGLVKKIDPQAVTHSLAEYADMEALVCQEV
jgi:[acyl-carrier-protein] S-malonyltransferase